MTHKIDELDFTPPASDAMTFPRWLIENFNRVYQTLINGVTNSFQIGEFTYTYAFGVLLSVELTEIFDDEFGDEFQ